MASVYIFCFFVGMSWILASMLFVIMHKPSSPECPHEEIDPVELLIGGDYVADICRSCGKQIRKPGWT